MSLKPANIVIELTESDLRTSTNDYYVWFQKTDGTVDYKVKKSTLQAALCGYKRYRVNLTQVGTNAPGSVVFENTLGGNPVFGYTSAGVYTITLAGAWVAGETFKQIDCIGDGSIKVTRTSADVLTIRTFNNANVATDALLIETGLDICVYNNIIS